MSAGSWFALLSPREDAVGSDPTLLGATDAEARLFARWQILTWMREGATRTIEHLREPREEMSMQVSREQREAAWSDVERAIATERGDAAEAVAARRGVLLGEAERRTDLGGSSRPV